MNTGTTTTILIILIVRGPVLTFDILFVSFYYR